jgi:D-3-phosphoglycerate dehydrogenase / 2-oxoglutarate reductase
VKPRIVVLEPWRFPEAALGQLRSLGEVDLYDPARNLFEATRLAEVLVVRLKYHIDRAFLERSPNLKIISTATTGLDHIDLAMTAARGIEILSLRGETEFLRGVTATAEHSWGLLLALLRHIPEAHQSVTKGEWDRTAFFGRELQNRTLGIVGLGRIGRMVAEYGLAFRMRVAAYDPFQAEWVANVGRTVALEELAKTADVLSIHVPLCKETERLVGRQHFEMMRGDAVLVNTSRGAVVDQEALLDALERGRIAGAALDVVEDEYNAESNLRRRLISYAAAHHNLILTPHLGGATFDSLEKVENFMAHKLASHLEQKPLR